MTVKYENEPLAIGTVVSIRNTNYGPVRISEYRGPLGPGGARIYGIYVGKKPKGYIEVREDQLEVLPEKE